MKGEYGQECNITSCQKPNSANWFNHFNQKYYCEVCANRLNNDEFNKKDSQRILGHQMCTKVVENNIEVKNFMRETTPTYIEIKPTIDFTETLFFDKPKSKFHK